MLTPLLLLLLLSLALLLSIYINNKLLFPNFSKNKKINIFFFALSVAFFCACNDAMRRGRERRDLKMHPNTSLCFCSFHRRQNLGYRYRRQLKNSCCQAKQRAKNASIKIFHFPFLAVARFLLHRLKRLKISGTCFDSLTYSIALK